LVLGLATSARFLSQGVMATAAPDAQALQELWASAYEGWVEPPGATAGEVVYLSPREPEEGAAPEVPAWVQETLAVSDKFNGVFGITAFNPMGQDEPHAVNMAQNKLLEADLAKLCAETGGQFWRSFGFAGDWHEKGFTVSAPEEKIVEIGKKYRQGAIYRFYRPIGEQCGGGHFGRATVPASLPDTDADVAVWASARPEWPQADPNWAPEA